MGRPNEFFRGRERLKARSSKEPNGVYSIRWKSLSPPGHARRGGAGRGAEESQKMKAV